MMLDLPVFTVSEINGYVKKMFDSEPMMQSIMISGEISNYSSHYRTGHLYFSLKDDSSAIKAVMFARQAARLRFIPENGMKVIALGRVSAYERDGVYQIYVENMQPDGAGSLAVAFEQLKKKLAAEGLFDESKKKKIPVFPKRVGVITSPTGAAVQDIFHILGRRFPLAEVIFQPVSVQGTAAPGEMIAALNEFNRKRCADVIIIGRGGGSTEDLWCFNDELLARCISRSEIPVISAVGHETDFTICDFVSDLRAPTPSAAAELAVPDMNDLIINLSSLSDRLYLSAYGKIREERKRLEAILSARDFSDPGKFFDPEKQKVENLSIRLRTSFERRVSAEKTSLARSVASLESLNPLSVLLRGYSVIQQNGAIAGSVRDIDPAENLNVLMADGELICKVIEKKEKSIE